MSGPDRYQLRTTLTKPTPEPTDLVSRELAFSVASKRLFYKDPVSGEVYPIGGKEIFDLIGRMNLLPSSPSVSGDVIDASKVLTGNLIANATDPDGDTITIKSVTFNSVEYPFGTNVNTNYGTLFVTAAGLYTFTMSNQAFALTTGQSVTLNFSFRLLDARGGVSSPIAFTVTITGTNQGPIAGQDAISIPPGQETTGNLLTNDADYEGNALQIVRWRVAGDSQVYLPGQTAQLGAAGSARVDADGAFAITPTPDYYDLIPRLTYTVSDGTSEQDASVVLVALKPPATAQETKEWFLKYRNGEIVPTNIAPNPIVGREDPTFAAVENNLTWAYHCPLPDHIGADLTSYDFRVGPGMEYTELNQVPWFKLQAGDRVFVYWRQEPYRSVIPLHKRGDLVRWIEIIGVRDPVTGALPVLDGEGAVEDPANCKFNSTHNGAGMIHVILPLGYAPSTYKPGYIHIHGFEIKNAFYRKALTLYTGASSSWGSFAAGIKVMGGDHITISGCKIHDNVLGIFGNSTPDLGPRFVTTNLHVLFNHFANNGLKDDFSTHNSYTEGIGTLYEYNFFDPITAGCYGDIIKDRSTGNIFRYNYFRCGASNAISIRDPEATYNIGYTSRDSQGVLLAMNSFVYANMFEHIQGSATIGYGDGVFSKHEEVRGGGFLCFYRNRVVQFRDGTGGFFQNIPYDSFCIALFEFWNSRADTGVIVLNNMLYSEKKTASGLVSPIGIFAWKGVVTQCLQNFVHNVQPVCFNTATDNSRSDAAVFAKNSLPYLGSMDTLQMANSSADPGFVNAPGGDYGLLPSSPFHALNAPYPTIITSRGLTPDDDPVMYPFGELPKPVALWRPYVTGILAAGQTVTGIPAPFSPLPDTHLYEFLIDGVVVGTGLTYTLASTDAGKTFVFRHTAGNASGLTVSESLPRVVATSTTPQNVVKPVISGSRQATYPIEINYGEWTNNPVSYSIQWYRGLPPNYDMVAIPAPEGTQFQITPPLEDVGTAYAAFVYATNDAGETGFVAVDSRSILPVEFDPDAYGKFNFQAASGQTLAQLDPRWYGYLLYGSYLSTTYYFCNGSGKLVGNYIARNNGGRVWFQNGQDDMVPVTMTFEVPAAGGTINAEAGIALRVQDAGATHISFIFATTPMRVYVNKNRSTVNGASWALSLPAGSSVTMRVVPLSDVQYQIYINGELFQTYTDTAPLTGGYPGFELNPGSDELFGIDSWHDA